MKIKTEVSINKVKKDDEDLFIWLMVRMLYVVVY